MGNIDISLYNMAAVSYRPPPSILATVVQVSEPVVFQDENGSLHYIPFTSIKSRGKQVEWNEIPLGTQVKVKLEPLQAYLIQPLILDPTPVKPVIVPVVTIRCDMQGLSPELSQKFAQFRTLPNLDSNSTLFFGFLESSFLISKKSMLVDFSTHLGDPGLYQNMQYCASFLYNDFSAQNLETLASSIGSLGTQLKAELLALTKAFKQKETDFPYAESAVKEIQQNEVWELHILATFFNVAIVEVHVIDGRIEFVHYSPNVNSPYIYQIYYMIDKGKANLLYPIEVLPAFFGGSQQFNESLFVPNYFRDVVQMRNLLNDVEGLKNIGALSDLREIARAADELFTSATQALSFKTYNEAAVLQYPNTKVTHTADPIIWQTVEIVRKRLRDGLQLSEDAPNMLVQLLDNKLLCSCGNKATHSLKCDHGICENCVFTQVTEIQLLFCEKDMKAQSLKELVPPLSSQLRQSVAESSRFLTCSLCSGKHPSQSFPLNKKFKDTVQILDCGDKLCSRCLESAVRKKTNTCPVCKLRVNLHEEDFDRMLEKCCNCKQEKRIVSNFSHIVCAGQIPSHRSCRDCISKFSQIDTCRECGRSYTPEEKKWLDLMIIVKCKLCDKKLRNKQIWQRASLTCGCVLCEECAQTHHLKSLDFAHCPGCNADCSYPTEIVLSLFNSVRTDTTDVLYEEVGDYLATRQKRLEKSSCAVCYGPITSQFDKYTSGNCLHFFHKDCLAEHIRCMIDNLINKGEKHWIMCGAGGCTAEISTAHLTGEHQLISDEKYDEYNNYFLKLEEHEFVCGNPDCKEPKGGCIDKNFVHFLCRCGRDQCVKCKGEWVAGHNEQSCHFFEIEALIKAYYKLDCADCKNVGCDKCAFAQCPNCKFPYNKDTHCDHVVCTRPGCRTEFCFRCSCLRQPTMKHDMHWHRKQCRNYPKDDSEAKTRHIIEAEKMNPQCPECIRLGKKCLPPPDLLVSGRFAQAEY